MTTKVRNKSAAHQYNNNNNNNHENGGIYNNQQSLLKIESVVPKLTSRTLKHNKLTKSHSTLTSAYIKKVNESKRTFVVGHNNNNNHHHLHHENGSAADASIYVNNGVYTVKRNQREREKLPDRINLDRKGMTMIPMIEDEPNLRLLSLQHNLINVFHVPSETELLKLATSKAAGGERLNNEVEQGRMVPNSPSNGAGVTTPANPATTTTSGGTTHKPVLTRQLSRQRSITTRNQLFLNNNNINYLGNAAKVTLGRTTPTQPQPATVNQPSFLQKSLLLNAQPKHILKKSNSFIQNYPNFLAKNQFSTNTTATNNGTNVAAATTTTSTTNNINSTRNKLVHTPSFSVENLSSTTATTNNQTTTTSPPSLRDEPGHHSTTDLTKLTTPSRYQHDIRVEIRHSLANLVFLDLYDNQIEAISNLDGLRSLTVLLLGKNRITDISGLVSVKNTLRVLDLHGNKIANITQKISPLQELKSLNLAGNLLKQVNEKDLSGLFALKELNLKRNKLRKIVGFEDLRSLERLWLCHNELQRVEDMSSVARATNLKEVTIENNPVSLAGDCVSFLVSYLPNLVSLSQMQITEQVRRAAAAWRRNKEASDANYMFLTTDVCQNMRREEIISNARTNWELLRSQQPVLKHNPATHHLENGNKKTGKPQAPASKFRRGRRMLKPTSRDNSVVSEQGGEDYFRLPPILAPFLDHPKDSSPNSNSSLGPNIDSGSSIYSSDADENNKDASSIQKNEAVESEKQIVVTVTEEASVQQESAPDMALIADEVEKFSPVLTAPTTPRVMASPAMSNGLHSTPSKLLNEKLEALALPVHELNLPISAIVANEDLSQVDKQSNISTGSVKSNESINTNVSSSERAEKCRSAMPRRQNTVTSISRAQTARNTSSNATNNSSNTGNSNQKPQTKAERDREQGGDYLIEICGRYLNVYGQGALRYVDKQWNLQKAVDVHTIKFSYISYNSITAVLSKIKGRFPNAENYVFRETNIYCLGQLNSLAETQGLVSLIIEDEGNPISNKLWRPYAIYRLSHWGLKTINAEDITEDEIHNAEMLYAGLSDLVLWSLPEGLLQPLLARLRLEETCQASKMTAKEWLMQAEASLKSVVGKEALQWKKAGSVNDELAIRDKGKKHFSFMMENTCNAVEKLQRLESLWSTVLLEMVRNTLIDYSQIDTYVKNLLQDLTK